METFITILAVCLIIYLLSLFMKILPYLFILLGTMLFIFLLYRLYEYIFFHSEKFLNIKKRISTVVCDYNEMNEHIERLKDTKLVSHDVRYGESNDKNLNKLSSKRIFFKDKKINRYEVDKVFKKHTELAKLTPIHFHGLRHSMASLMINKGFNVLLVSKHLRHANTQQTLNTYSHLFPKITQDYMEQVFK